MSTQPSTTPPSIHIDSFWLPAQGSTIAPQIDFGWDVVLWLSVVFFVLIVGAMTVFAIKYKRKSDDEPTNPIDHSTKLEVTWTLIPSLLIMGLFGVGLSGYINSAVAPAEAYEIKVTAQMYSWTFAYPDGTVMVNQLGLPKGRPIKLIMSSTDVLHSFYVPEFRVKQDVVPSLYTTLWFEATETRETALLCTEYCGVGHSDMLAKVKVMEEPEFEKWLETGGGTLDLPPEELGRSVVANKSCITCHSIDGSQLVGPTLKGLYGKQEPMADGSTVTVDENYIRESLLAPQAKIVKGYPGTMPTFQGVLKDREIDGVIAYLKTLK